MTDSHSSDVTDITHCVLGDDQLGIAIADRLHADGTPVAVVNERYESEAVPSTVGELTDRTLLAAAGVDGAETVIVGTRSDRRNLLLAQLVRSRFDVPRVVALVADPDRCDLFADAGHEPFCVTTALSEQVIETV